MKKVIFNLLAALLLTVALPMAQAQELALQSLTSEEAHQLLGKISGSWLISHHAWQPHSNTFYQTTGEANISHANQGSYLLEQTVVHLPDGSKQRQESFLGYSAVRERFELIQAELRSRNTTLMVGQWHPEYNAITFTHPDGLKKGGPNNTEYVYVFLPENVLLKIVRTLDADGNYVIQSKDYYAPRHTASH